MTSATEYLNEIVGCTPRAARQPFSAWPWNATQPRTSCPIDQATPLQRVFGFGHRLPADLTSDDVYSQDPIYDLAATDACFEESRQIREAAMKADAEVFIRDRIEDSVRARPRTHTVVRAGGVIMVWKTNPPSKRGWPVVCIGTHRGSVWVGMRGSLWKCSHLQCKLATTEESRDLEIQNKLPDDMKAELSFRSSPAAESTLMWSVRVLHQKMLTVRRQHPVPPRKRRTGPQL